MTSLQMQSDPSVNQCLDAFLCHRGWLCQQQGHLHMAHSMDSDKHGKEGSMGTAGGILQGILFPLNLGRLSNSVALWLNIEPYELFFYVFLPPLLLDAAVKLDFFLFKKVHQQPSSCIPATCVTCTSFAAVLLLMGAALLICKRLSCTWLCNVR